MGVVNGSDLTLVNINEFKKDFDGEEGEDEQEEMEAEQEDINEAMEGEGQEKNE